MSWRERSLGLEQRQHSLLAASAASRWMACPGSIRMTRGVPEEASPYAEEGNVAHEISRICLQEDREPRDSLASTSAT